MPTSHAPSAPHTAGVYYSSRNVLFEVREIGEAETEWIRIEGHTTFTKSASDVATETTHAGSQGAAESQVMERTKTLSIQSRGFNAPGLITTDPGQAEVERLAERVGQASICQFRFRQDAAGSWEVWNARVSMGDSAGGGNNDHHAWSATFTRSGPHWFEAAGNGNGGNGGGE